MATAVSEAEYVQIANVISITRICQTVGAIIVLYDHVITFDGEIDHVWRVRPSSFGSIIYLCIRYFGDALSILNLVAFLGKKVPTVNFCTRYFFIQGWLGILIVFLIQLMLQLRLYALYRRSRIILTFMIFGYVCEIVAMAVIMGYLAEYAKITNNLLGALYICGDVKAPSFYRAYVIWLPVLVYDGLLCLLALWSGIDHWRSGHCAERLHLRCIADTLVVGNVAYFFSIILGTVIASVLGQYFGVTWAIVSQGFPAPVETMAGCRLILSLRVTFLHDKRKEHSELVSDAFTPYAMRPLVYTASGTSSWQTC